MITSINPASVTAGSGDFTMTINGTNFCDQAVVTLRSDGAIPDVLGTVFVGGTTLEASVPAGSVSVPKVFQVVVNHPEASACLVKGDSNSVPFAVLPMDVGVVNLVQNGSFEDPAQAGPGEFLSVAVGWTSDIDLFIWRDFPGVPAHDGSQHIALDSLLGTTTIFQDLATVPGKTYRLSFAVANRPELSGISLASPLSRIEASWDGNVVLSAERTEDTWKVFEAFVMATSDTMRLQF